MKKPLIKLKIILLTVLMKWQNLLLEKKVSKIGGFKFKKLSFKLGYNERSLIDMFIDQLYPDLRADYYKSRVNVETLKELVEICCSLDKRRL